MITDPGDSKRYPPQLLDQTAACRELLAASGLRLLKRELPSDTAGGRNRAVPTGITSGSEKRREQLPETVDIVKLIHDARARFGNMTPGALENDAVDGTVSSIHPSSMEVFVEGVAHHFNNLFMAIQGYVSLLMRDIDPLHPGIVHLQRIEKLIHGESILTNDLLRFLIGRPCRISNQDQTRLLREIGKVASSIEAATGRRRVTCGKLTVSSPPEQILRNLSGSMACILGQLLSEIHEQAALLNTPANMAAQAHQRFQKIQELTQQGLRPVCQLLGYAGHTDVPNGHRVARIGLIDLLRETIVFKKENIRLFMDVDADLAKIKLQRRQLAEILMAVVDNAAEAMSRGGDLFFEAVNLRPEEIDEPGWHVPARHFIRLTFRDCGRGFDPRFGRLIFEPFFTNKGRGGHCGLGLSSIYGMVNTLGGYIGVDSEPGRGTVFHVYLPSERANVSRKSASKTRAFRSAAKQVMKTEYHRRRDTGRVLENT